MIFHTAVPKVLRFRELEACGHQFRVLGLEYSVIVCLSTSFSSASRRLPGRGVTMHQRHPGFES